MLTSIRQAIAERVPLRRVPEPPLNRIRPTWRDARVPRIEKALEVARAQGTGGWHVVGASGDIPTRESVIRTVADRELVLWRDGDELRAGPGSCPHMGAKLDRCPVFDGEVVCRWHGLALGPAGFGDWTMLRAHDDGVLAWVQLPTDGDNLTDAPRLTARPPVAESLVAVISFPAACEPDDVIANRLDPWHGAWFHPYAFSHLSVDESASDHDKLTVDVTFRLDRTWGVPVRAEFACPDARTIVMTIIEGEGVGSVVETHATPVFSEGERPARTMITEAVIAHSDRPGFGIARRFSPLIVPLMKRTAHQLWVDDQEYAERRFEVRQHPRLWQGWVK